MKSKPLIFVLAALAVAAVVWVMLWQPSHDPANTENTTKTETHKPPTQTEESPNPIAHNPTPVDEKREEIKNPEKMVALANTTGEGVVIGRIVEANGQPVPKFKVESYGTDLRSMLPDMGSWFDEKAFMPNLRSYGTLTDDEGKFTLKKFSSRAVYVLGLDIGGNRPQIRILDQVPNPGETVNLGDVQLEPFVVFTGRVIDAAGAPVAGARVRASILPVIVFAAGIAEVEPKGAVLMLERMEKQVFTAPTWVQQIIERFPTPTTTTDSQGVFKLEGVQIGQATVLVDIKNKPILQHGPVSTGQSGEKNLGDLRMEDGEEVTGKVLDAAKKPIAGAEVFVGPKSPLAPAAVLHPIGKTDSEGKFSAKGFKGVASYAVARLDAASPWGISEEFAPGVEDAIVTLQAGYDLILTLKTSDGKIVPTAEVLLKSMVAAREFPILMPPVPLQGRISNEKDGSLRISRLNPGRYIAIVRATGYAITTQEVEVKDQAVAVEISLPAAATARVRVLDKQSGSPIENARITVRPADSKRWMVSLNSATTNSSGEATVSNIAAGSYLFETSHPLYATETSTTSVPTEALTVNMDGGGILEGRVHQGGRNIDMPRMLVLEYRGERRNFAIPRITSTDFEGKFRVTNLESGEYRIYVNARTVNQGMFDLMKAMQAGPQKMVKAQVLAGKTTTQNIDLSNDSVEGPSGRITGRVSLNGRPAANISVSMWDETRKTATTDATGYFDLGQVLSGNKWVSISMPANDGQIEPYELGSRSITLKEGETLEVNWDFRTGVVRGHLTREKDGKSASFLPVRATITTGEDKKQESSWLHTTSDKNGDFIFDPAPVGKWSISVRQNGFVSQNANFQLSEGEDKSGVEIRLESAIRVTGKVVIPAGVKFDWIWLKFRQGDVKDKQFTASREADARVDKDQLTFVCDSITPGKYTVQLNTWTRGQKSSTDWEPQIIEVQPGGMEGVTLTFNLLTSAPSTNK